MGDGLHKMVIGALALGLALGGAAHAGGAPKDDPLDLPLEGVTTNPDWLKTPSGDDFAREYPRLAQWMQLAGGAVITCQAETDGRVDNCTVVSEWPAGLGFGAAAVRISRSFTMKPATRDGVPVTGQVQIPINFQPGRPPRQPPADPVLPMAAPAALALARQILAVQDIANKLQLAWSKQIDLQAAAIIASGTGQVALADFRRGLEDAANDEMEREAHYLAAKMSLAELQDTLSFLKTPAGKSWVASEAAIQPEALQDVARRLPREAAARFCAHVACGPQPSTTASDKPSG